MTIHQDEETVNILFLLSFKIMPELQQDRRESLGLGKMLTVCAYSAANVFFAVKLDSYDCTSYRFESAEKALNVAEECCDFVIKTINSECLQNTPTAAEDYLQNQYKQGYDRLFTCSAEQCCGGLIKVANRWACCPMDEPNYYSSYKIFEGVTKSVMYNIISTFNCDMCGKTNLTDDGSVYHCPECILGNDMHSDENTDTYDLCAECGDKYANPSHLGISMVQDCTTTICMAIEKLTGSS